MSSDSSIGRIAAFAVGLLSALAGCGDAAGGAGAADGSGGAGGSQSTAEGGSTSSGGTTSGGTTSGDTTTSGAATTASTMSASTGGGACVQEGGGTPEEANTAYDAFCVAQNDLVDAVCTDEEFDCEEFRPIFLDDSEGCEAELTAGLECAVRAIAAADPEGCTCNGGSPVCDDLGPDTCAAEFDALEICLSCE